MWSEVKSLSWLFGTPWTVAHQDPLSMGFSRQEYWSGLPFPSPGDLPLPGIEPRSPTLKADTLTSEPPGKPVCFCIYVPLDSLSCDTLYINVYIYMYVCYSHVSNSSWPRGLKPTMLLWPRNPPGKSSGVYSYALLQGIVPTQGLNPGLMYCRQILYSLNYLGSPTCTYNYYYYSYVIFFT